MAGGERCGTRDRRAGGLRPHVGFCPRCSGAAALAGYFSTGADPAALVGWLLLACAFSFGLFSLITGPISAEAAPPGMIATTARLIAGAVSMMFLKEAAPRLVGRLEKVEPASARAPCVHPRTLITQASRPALRSLRQVHSSLGQGSFKLGTGCD